MLTMVSIVRRPGTAAHTGQLPRYAVVAVAGQGPADRNDEPSVGVDDYLVTGGVPIVLRLLSRGVITCGHYGAVDGQHGGVAEAPALLQG
ncbi:hypothetical protein GCM10022207_89810 [Streptomyces lannensis]|uniref:Uncharacterized protein n=1 Tax=Streptomyces lannensis TaxID=766498 RepID=A0ABP7LQ74_9ACTN